MHNIAPMTEDQQSIQDAVAAVCREFDAEYWRKTDETGNWPEEFTKAMADGGWLGIAMPEEVGGSGLGLKEASIMMQTVARSGAGFTGCSSIHLNIFGAKPIEKFGTSEQKQEFLPKIISGQQKMCFGVTEPNSGLDTSSLETRAERTNSGYVINGRKIWTTGAQRADKILLIARTTPKDKVAKPYMGLSLFYCDMKGIEAKPIPKMGRKAVECNMLYFDNVEIPKESLIGEEGQGFKYLLQGLNPERVLFAVEAIGLGFAALERASTYAKERVVFGRPIGQNQGVAHPLAKCVGRTRPPNCSRTKPPTFTTRALSAALKPTLRSISAPKPASPPAKRRCWRTAAWATRKSTTSSATCAKR